MPKGKPEAPHAHGLPVFSIRFLKSAPFRSPGAGAGARRTDATPLSAAIIARQTPRAVGALRARPHTHTDRTRGAYLSGYVDGCASVVEHAPVADGEAIAIGLI